MKYFIVTIITFLLLTSCTEEHTQSKLVDETAEKEYGNVSFEERVELHVRSQLHIASTEKYTIDIYKAHLNDDEVEDAIITINRLDFAVKRAEEGRTMAKSSELDFWGNYNLVFYYDSELDKISPPLEFNSTPLRKLKVSFANVTSEHYKDAVIDYPLRNAQYRIYLPIINHIPTQVLQWKVYDGWGTEQVEAYCFSYKPGTYSPFKDIVVTKANLKNIERGEDYNKIVPEISCTDEVVKKLFFYPKDGKYYAPK